GGAQGHSEERPGDVEEADRPTARHQGGRGFGELVLGVEDDDRGVRLAPADLGDLGEQGGLAAALDSRDLDPVLEVLAADPNVVAAQVGGDRLADLCSSKYLRRGGQLRDAR